MVKRILKKFLIVILILLILNNFFISEALADVDDVVKVIEGILGGIVGILTLPFRFLAIQIGNAINWITAQIAYTEKPTDTSIDTETLTPFDILYNKVPILDINFFEIGDEENIVNQIRTGVATWYYVLRILASAILLVILIYVGIRMAISTVASDRAMYKKMLVDWVCSLALIFLIQYIIIFTLNINNALVNAMSITSDSQEISKAFDVIRDESMKIFSLDAVGATVIYCMLVWQTIGLLISYFNRMLKIAFLIIISPLITITYSIDKMGDGKAQALGKWLKEFAFTILIQPFHCIIYMCLINTAIKMLVENVALGGTGSIRDSLATALIAILCVRFVKEAEKIVRKIFAFQDDNSGTSLVAGMAASAVLLSNAKKFGKTTRSAVNNIGNLGRNGMNMARAARVEALAIGAMIKNKDGTGKSFEERKEEARTDINTKKAEKINSKLDKKEAKKLKQAKGDANNAAKSAKEFKRASEEDINKRKNEIIGRNGGSISEKEAESQARLELAKERRTARGPVRSKIHNARGNASRAMKVISSSATIKELANKVKGVAKGSAALVVGAGVYGTGGNIATAITAGASIHGGMQEFMKNSSRTIINACKENLTELGAETPEEINKELDEIFNNNRDNYGDINEGKAKEALDDILKNLNLNFDGKFDTKVKSIINSQPDVAPSKLKEMLEEAKMEDGTIKDMSQTAEGKELLDFANRHAILNRAESSSDIISENALVNTIKNEYAMVREDSLYMVRASDVTKELEKNDTAELSTEDTDTPIQPTDDDYKEIADDVFDKMKDDMEGLQIQNLEEAKRKVIRAFTEAQEELDGKSIELAREFSHKLEEEVKKINGESERKNQLETIRINLNKKIKEYEEKG